MRLTIRVTPGSRQPGVGGSHEGAHVVRVRERAAEGRATEAALAALADALGVPRRSVRLIHGATSRAKLVEVEGQGAALEARLETLM
jgi:uncharacterized protein YggU (UPF0235/DUF167 family)